MKTQRIKVDKPPITQIFLRISYLIIALLAAAGVAFTWFSWGVSWAYDSTQKYSPFLSCPTFILNGAGGYPTAPLCAMRQKYTFDLAQTISGGGFLSSSINSRKIGTCSLDSNSSPSYINCYWADECKNLCQLVGTGALCPDPSTLQNPKTASNPSSLPQCNVVIGSIPTQQVACYYVSMESYCDSGFAVTPSNEMAMRGIVLASLVIILIWFIAEFVLREVEINLRKDVARGKLAHAQTLPLKIQELRILVENRWAVETLNRREIFEDLTDPFPDDVSVRSVPSSYVGPSPLARQTMPRIQYMSTPRSSRIGGESTPESTFSSPLARQGTKPKIHDPKRLFSSAAWKRRLERYLQLRADKRSEFKSREFLRSLILFLIYFALIVVTVFVVIKVSPQHIGPSSDDFLEVLRGQVSLWKMHSVLDIIVFIDILLDFVLLMIAAVCVKWPKPPVFSQHLQAKLGEALQHYTASRPSLEDSDLISANSLVDKSMSADTESLSFVLKQSLAYDVCLMIACHQSCITEEKSETFAKTLKAALLIFPPAHIFICDNGPSPNPVDDTQWVTQGVHPDINYLYVPEGNKTFAFYWCNKYWIPFLSKCQVVPNFTYVVIIDDDVPLPSDLHIPHEHLRQHPEVKAVHFPITAACPEGKPNLLVRCQDIEYKLAGVHKQFQSMMSRCLSCHGAIALWERQAMGEVFFYHDTVFHGEDMYMGLTLLRKRDSSRIISAPQSIVPTYAPGEFSMLFRQRVKSWELTSHRKTITYLKEFLSPQSFCHKPSLVLKPYFLQEIITILLDWLRIYLLCGLLLRDWIGLLAMTAFFMALMYVQVMTLSFLVLRSRKTLRPSLLTAIMFPLYRFCGLVFRICALCHNLLVYSHDRSGMKIGKREDEVKDIPPTPPCHIVNWFTVWKP